MYASVSRCRKLPQMAPSGAPTMTVCMHTHRKGHASAYTPPTPNSRQRKPTSVLTPISTTLVAVDAFS